MTTATKAPAKKSTTGGLQKLANKTTAKVQPKADSKMAAANDKPETVAAQPQASTTTPEQTPATPVQTESQAPKADSTPKKEKEVFLPEKLRSKETILKALRAGGFLYLDKGLYRMKNSDGSKNRVSKRRAALFTKSELVTRSTVDEVQGWVVSPEVDKVLEVEKTKKAEKKASPTPATSPTPDAVAPNATEPKA